MRYAACILGLSFLIVSSGAAAQVVTEMTSARIAEAIAASQDRDVRSSYSIQDKSVVRGSGPYLGEYTTPFSRVVLAAREARKKYTAFTIADVTAEMIASEVHVYAGSRIEGFGTDSRANNVQAVVVLPKGRRDLASATHPLRTSDLTEDLRNIFGAVFPGKGLVAVFPLSVLSEANELHIVYAQAFFAGGRRSDDWAVPFRLKDVR